MYECARLDRVAREEFERGRESAALYVAREGAGYGGGNDRWIDVRVDDHVDPIGELGRLLALQRLYLDRPAIDELLRLDEALAGDLRRLLAGLGAGPGSAFSAVYQPMSALSPEAAAAEREARPMTGQPAPASSHAISQRPVRIRCSVFGALMRFPPRV